MVTSILSIVRTMDLSNGVSAGVTSVTCGDSSGPASLESRRKSSSTSRRELRLRMIFSIPFTIPA